MCKYPWQRATHVLLNIAFTMTVWLPTSTVASFNLCHFPALNDRFLCVQSRRAVITHVGGFLQLQGNHRESAPDHWPNDLLLGTPRPVNARYTSISPSGIRVLERKRNPEFRFISCPTWNSTVVVKIHGTQFSIVFLEEQFKAQAGNSSQTW